MLDEIDCIGLKRGIGGNGGSDGEISRTTISLMQALDDLTDGQIIIALRTGTTCLIPLCPDGSRTMWNSVHSILKKTGK